MKKIKEKLQNLEKLTEKDFAAIIEEQSKQIDLLRDKNFKLANVKANEGITRPMFAKYNYLVELFTIAPEHRKNDQKTQSENLAKTILTKMEWWQL